MPMLSGARGTSRTTAESTFGGGRNAPGGDVEQRRDRAAGLQHHAQPAIDLAARPGGHAVDDFLLQHEMHVAHRRGVVERMEQDRRGQVVGQVADQADLPVRARAFMRERGEIDVEHVARGSASSSPCAARGLGQRHDQVAVELDRRQRAMAVEQRERDRALARADLDQAVAGLRIDREHDLVDDAAVVQEVLAQRLLGAVIR